jgi:hypothetical protein
MKSITARAASVAAAALLVLLVSGCEDFALGPMAIKRDGASLLVAVCVDVDLVGVYAEEQNNSEGIRSAKFFEASGSARVTAGTIFSSDAPWSGLTSTVQSAPDLRAGSDILYQLDTPTATAESQAHFLIGSGGLSSSEWLHPDGSTTTQPCDGVQP